MVKETAEVIKEFNEVVNMSASELKSWIETDDSKGSGWTGGDNAGGETVGHESATKIIKILEGNPKKEESKYSEEDVAHMRKVVAYCARHLAQEGKMVDEKGEEELKQTKSYKSLKNWGHDSLKAKNGGSSEQASKKEDEQEKQTEQPNESAKDDKEPAEEEKDEKAGSSKAEPETGDKRKADAQGVEQSEKTGKDEQTQPDSKKQKEDHHDTSKQQDDGGHSASQDSTTKQSNGSDKQQGGKAQASASSSPPSQGSKRSTRSSAK